MDNSNSNISKNKQNELLGVNKFGKNIRKINCANYNYNYNNNANNIGNSGANYTTTTNNNNKGKQQQPQPQVYNISKNDFRNIVQQLTVVSPSQPSSNPPKQHPNTRLQRFRPPPLSPINRPLLPHVVAAPQSHLNNSNSNSNSNGNNNSFGRVEPNWTTPALSPISAYVQQLESCIGEDGPKPGLQPMLQTQMTAQIAGQNGLQQQFFDGYMPVQPSAGSNASTILQSPYPLLSPGSQLFPPFGFFSPGSQPILSPVISFPLSPAGFFPISSPRWRDQ